VYKRQGDGIYDDTIMTTVPAPSLPLPPGYMPQKGGKVEPFAKKRVQNTLASVTAGYNSMGKDHKMAVSLLVMQLDDLLLADSTKSREVETKGGLNETYVVNVPTHACLAAEPKKRKMTAREHAVRKMNKSLQNQGWRQNLHVNDDYDITLNGKQRSTCSFCGTKNHQISNCDKRAEMRMRGHEHILTTTIPMNEIALRDTITNSMPIVASGKECHLLGTAVKGCENSSFIIHKASLIDGGTRGCMDHMIFCISFIGESGTVIEGSLTKDVWINGRLMNSLTTHKIKRKKYVYDETIGTIGRVGIEMKGSAEVAAI